MTILNGAADADAGGVYEWTADAEGASDYDFKYLFQGARFDAVTGLYDLRNRDYSPVLERFLEQDPNPAGQYNDGANLYQMERSNPLVLVDPSGLVGDDLEEIDNLVKRHQLTRAGRGALHELYKHHKGVDGKVAPDILEQLAKDIASTPKYVESGASATVGLADEAAAAAEAAAKKSAAEVEEAAKKLAEEMAKRTGRRGFVYFPVGFFLKAAGWALFLCDCDATSSAADPSWVLERQERERQQKEHAAWPYPLDNEPNFGPSDEREPPAIGDPNGAMMCQ